MGTSCSETVANPSQLLISVDDLACISDLLLDVADLLQDPLLEDQQFGYALIVDAFFSCNLLVQSGVGHWHPTRFHKLLGSGRLGALFRLFKIVQ